MRSQGCRKPQPNPPWPRRTLSSTLIRVPQVRCVSVFAPNWDCTFQEVSFPMTFFSRGGVSAAFLATSFLSLVASAQVRVDAHAPAFTATDSHGQAQSLSQYRGKYVVLEWHNQGC